MELGARSAADQRAQVSSRVRLFEILFYLVDGTLEIGETNGPRFLKRTRVPKGAAPPPGEPVTSALGVEDLAVASDLTIYSQTFHVVACDNFTRAFYAEQGMEQAADLAAPQTARETQSARASAAAARAHTQSASQRGVQFLQNDGKVLRFTGLLFDPALEGGSTPVTLNMYLADDTGEVKVTDSEAGLLLHRQRLPLELPSTGVASFGQHDGSYLRADMLRVGGTHTIYARRIQLLDCDAFSRSWFREQNIEQPEAIPGPAPPPPRQKAPIPPHNGYGSPADSARNCVSLIPKAMGSKDFHQYMAFTGKVLRFSASMEATDPVEKARSFVVNYFMCAPLFTYVMHECACLQRAKSILWSAGRMERCPSSSRSSRIGRQAASWSACACASPAPTRRWRRLRCAWAPRCGSTPASSC